jgi:hypothetical protein
VLEQGCGGVLETYRCYADERAEPWVGARLRLGASFGVVSPDTGDSIDLPATNLRSFGSLALPILGVSLRSLRSFAAIPLLFFRADKRAKVVRHWRIEREILAPQCERQGTGVERVMVYQEPLG